MTEFEYEIIRVIRESADPAKAIEIVVDMIQRLVAGEDAESIAASYGIKLKEVINQ